MTSERVPVRRPGDDELVGFIQFDDASAEWQALTVFGGELGRVANPGQARQLVLERGLASLAERWHWFSRRSGAWEVVLPQEARPGSVRVVVGYYALPGVPTVLITADDLAAGDRLTLARPSEGEHSTPPR